MILSGNTDKRYRVLMHSFKIRTNAIQNFSFLKLCFQSKCYENHTMKCRNEYFWDLFWRVSGQFSVNLYNFYFWLWLCDSVTTISNIPIGSKNAFEVGLLGVRSELTKLSWESNKILSEFSIILSFVIIGFVLCFIIKEVDYLVLSQWTYIEIITIFSGLNDEMRQRVARGHQDTQALL